MIKNEIGDDFRLKEETFKKGKNKKVNFCQVYYQIPCSNCKTPTYRRCSECDIWLCSVCEMIHQHQKSSDKIIIEQEIVIL